MVSVNMYTVEFPNLGWTFQINPVAFTIGTLEVRWYGIIIAVGFLLAFLYALRSCKKMNIDEDKLINCVIVGMITGVIGARLYYVLFYPGSDYIDNPMSVFDLRQGDSAFTAVLSEACWEEQLPQKSVI